jgi:ABC-type multidrug transport system ATPase subunit
VLPVSIEWSDISVTVRVGGMLKTKTSKQILAPTSGSASPGDLLAVMGPSGSGKTTLLDALADRLASSKVDGKVTFNGCTFSASERHRHISYVAQDDSLLGVFTVTETLLQAARFCYGYSLSSAQLKSVIDEAIETVGLRSAAHTVVGDIFRKGLSGGQKRRLSLAVELVKKPSILIIDEPTSGLDSASAYGVMHNLTLLCKNGHTIVTTIHQPSSEVRTGRGPAHP